MAATPLQFSANRFSNADVDQARRWGAAAKQRGCYLLTSMRPDTGKVHIVAVTETGDEYISVVPGDPQGGGLIFIAPQHGRWVVENAKPGGGHAVFATLQAALETVQPTASSASAA